MSTNAIYDYWLARTHGVPSSVKILLDQFYGSAKEVYAASDSSLSRRRFMKPEHVSAISRSRQIWDLEGEYALMCKDGARMVIWKDEEYPYMLCLLHDMPYAVYAKGRLPDVSRPSIAIVGARSCSPYGKKQAEILSRALAEAGVNIISGMALGIDGIAQRAAVSCGGYSLGILGSGIDLCYPERHHKLYCDLIENGGILSEYPLSEPPIRAHFPQRNRLISILSHAVIVIEAREKSGSLITADFALEQGRDVYAMPGPVDSLLSRGCHRLIEQGAKIVMSTEELLADLGKKQCKHLSLDKETELPAMTESEEKVFPYLSDTPVKLSELELLTGLEPAVLTNTLVSMQLKGIAKEFSLQHYVRV